MKKFNFDITTEESEQIIGGYITTVKKLTIKQVVAKMAKMGKDVIRDDKNIKKVCFKAWEEENYSENALLATVIIVKEGRKFNVTTITY